jgi:hypothetical protein
LRAPLAGIPLERDEGEYAYIAQRWLLGEVPYKGAFDQKPPAVFAAYAAILRTLGESPSAIHWGAQIYTLGTLAVLYALGRRLFSPAAGLAAAAFGAVLAADHSLLANAANTEIFMILPLAGALLATLLAVERDQARWSLLAGVLSVFGVLFKQVAATNLVFCFVWMLRSPRRRWTHAGLFSAGCALALLPTVAYFALAGAWGEFFDATVGHNLRYSGRVALAQYPGIFRITFAPILRSLWPIGVLALVGLARGLAPPRRRDDRRRARPKEDDVAPPRRAVGVVAAWGLFAFLGVATGGYFRAHYYQQLIPAVALLAGYGAASVRLGGRDPGGGRPLAAWAAGLAIAAVLVGAPWYYLRGATEAKCRRLYGDNPFPESRDVARFIAERTAPADRVFVFGSEPQILFHARRPSASRYIFVYPLMTPFEDARARQLEVLEDLERTRPKIIVTVFVPTSFLLSTDTHTEIFKGLSGVLASYRVEAVTPLRSASQGTLVTGEPARALWNATPMTYGGRTWASTVIWERVVQP